MISPEEIGKEIEALVRDHGAALKGYLRKLGLPEHLAGDVLTDALLAVADKRRREQPLPFPRAFSFRVARNAAVDVLKSRYARETPDSGAVEETQASVDNSKKRENDKVDACLRGSNQVRDEPMRIDLDLIGSPRT